MTGSATVTVNPLPNIYTVSGGGPYCSGGPCPHIILSASDAGIVYYLYDGTTLLSTIAGTGAAIDFGAICTPGVYTLAATNPGTGCTDTMGTETISTVAGPAAFTLTGGGSYCTSGGSCPHIGLSSSQSGISYSLYCGGALVGGPTGGTGGPIDFGPYCTSCSYTATGTNPVTGCVTNMGPATVTILGSIGAITGSTNVCTGYTSTLSDTTAGGTWSSSNTAVATIGSTTGVVMGVSAGTTAITYTVGSCTTTTIVTVPLGAVSPITGLHDLCQLDSERVHDATAGGYWSSTLVTIDPTGEVHAVNAGVASVTYTALSGCNIIDTILVNPLPVITTRDETICQETSTTYIADIGGGTWASSIPSVALVGSATGVVFGVSPGTSVISYTLNTGCTDTTLIHVNRLPAAIGGVPAMCLMQTTALSDSTVGGTFSSGNTAVATIGATSGVAFGVSLGTAVITYTLPTGCINTLTVSVNPIPLPITGPDTVCVASSVTLADATTGGVWLSSNTSVATIGSATGILNGVSAGTTIITYLSGAGCQSTYSFTVNGLPGTITGTDSLCVGVGTSIELMDTPAGGAWTSSNMSVATVDGSGYVTAVSQGTSIITYSVRGCIATDSIHVNPPPGAIAGVTTFCVGTYTVLTDTPAGGTWSSNNTSVAAFIAGTDTLQGLTVGTSIISYVLPTGCVATVSVSVTREPGPIMGNLNVCVGQTDTLTDSVAGGIWTSSNIAEATIGSLSGVITGISSGSPIIFYSLGSCSAHPVNINVFPLSPIIGPNTICTGKWLLYKILHFQGARGPVVTSQLAA